MTRTTNARIAGFAFLVYIAGGITSLILFGRASRGDGIVARLASLSQHTSDLGPLVLLGFVQSFSAVVLGVSLWAITREQDEHMAMLGLACRVGEGIIGALSIPPMLTLFQLATAAGIDGSSTGAHALAAHLIRPDVELPATFFAIGSTAFCWLLLRGRMIPTSLAWLGVVASVLLVILLPLQLAGFIRGPILQLMWLPMLVFEVWVALIFIIKGISAPARTRAG